METEILSGIFQEMITDWRYVFVADFEALDSQVTRKFIRCSNAETRTVSAIKYTACCAFVLYSYVKCNNFFSLFVTCSVNDNSKLISVFKFSSINL